MKSESAMTTGYSRFRRRRRAGLYPLLLGSLLLLVHPLMAVKPTIIRVGIYQNEPKIFRDETGTPAGIYVEILNKIAASEGWKLDYVPCFWEQCIAALRSQRIDLLPDMAFSRKRAKEYEFNHTPVIASCSQFYSRPGTPVSGFADLREKRVVVLRGSLQEESFARLMRGFGFNYSKITARSYEEAFTFVQEGIADVAITNMFFGNMNSTRYGLVPASLLVDPVLLHFVSKKGANRQILATIDHYLDRWIRTPRSFYYRTLSRYLINPAMPSAKRHRPWQWILFLMLLLSAAGVVLALTRRIVYKSRNLQAINRRLQEQESKFSGYIEHSPYGIFVTDRNGNYTEVNKAAAEITGYSQTELLKRSFTDNIPAKARRAARSHLNRVITHKKASGIFPFITKAGEQRFWSVAAVKISEETYLGFVEDVTDRHLAEAELRKLKDRLEAEVEKKTAELRKRIRELEHFHDVTIERELRLNDLREKIQRLKSERT